MGVNLESNASVVEKLIELNSELMDALNAVSTAKVHVSIVLICCVPYVHK